MPEPVKRRSYDATARRAASAQTRQRILDVARAMMIGQGYASTTMAAIAAAAGVHVDTVYALIGRKPDLARELVEHALSGTDRTVPAEERPYVAAILSAPTAAEKLAIYARATREMLERVAPLVVALRDAAGAEPAARSLWREFSERRAVNMRAFVTDVAAAGGLRDGLDLDEAADTVWATNSPELYVMLTDERGWSSARYERWLLTTWSRLLLP